mmetsp:Transcript_992/g.6206  ORF Transcript_992/g.6206 Transcript_992/m.6206 type:complete len:207 (+) Transcript_992:1552-2172(+)
MVGGFIHQQNICLQKHGPRKSKLHTPTTRQESHRSVHHDFGEADRAKDLHNGFLRHPCSLDPRIGQDVVNNIHLCHLSNDVCCHENRADFFCRGESFDLSIGNRPHQGGLSRIVATQQTILQATFQRHIGVVKKNLCTICESELAVAQLLRISILVHFSLLLHVLSTFSKNSLCSCCSIISTKGGQIRGQSLHPNILRVHLVLNER